jgi:hypothetical protein
VTALARIVRSGPLRLRPGPDAPEITVERDLLRGPRVEVDGRPVPRRREGPRIYWPIEYADGSEHRLAIAGQLTGLRAVVDGVEHRLEPPLAGWELGLTFAPIVLLAVLLGSVGALLGGLVTGLSFGLFRAPWPAGARIAVWVILVAIAIGVGYVVAPKPC